MIAIKNPYNKDRSVSAIAIGLAIDIDPCSSAVVMVEIAPKVPSSIFCLGPVPKAPSRDGSLVHIGHIEAIVELGPFGVISKVALAELVTRVVVQQIIPAHWHSHLNHTTCPAIVITAIDNSEGSILDCDPVVGSNEGLGRGDADQRQLLIAGLVALEGVAVIAREPTGPIVCITGPNGGLEGEALLDGLETVLIDTRYPAVIDGIGPACKQQNGQRQVNSSHLLCILLQARKNYCGLIIWELGYVEE